MNQSVSELCRSRPNENWWERESPRGKSSLLSALPPEKNLSLFLSQVSLPGLCKPDKQQLLLYLQTLTRTVPIPSHSRVLSGTFQAAPVQNLATAKILSFTLRLGTEIWVESSSAAPPAAAAPSPSKGLHSSKTSLGRSLCLSVLPPGHEQES